MPKLNNIRKISNVRLSKELSLSVIAQIINDNGDGFYMNPENSSTIYTNFDFTGSVTTDGDPVKSIENSTQFGHNLVAEDNASDGMWNDTNGNKSIYLYTATRFISSNEAGSFPDFYFATLVDLGDWSLTSRRHVFSINDNAPDLPPAINWGVENGSLAHWRGIADGKVLDGYDITSQSGIHLISGKQRRIDANTIETDIRFDGNIVLSTTGDYEDGSWPMELGKDGNGSFGLNGDMFGMVLIPTDLSQQDIDTIESELASKVGLII